MLIGGLQKSSFIDFPGKLSAIVFTQGCNMRCVYCHNPSLVKPEQFSEPMPAEDVLSFLSGRRGKLQGVVITGGEPTLHQDLPQFIEEIDFLGFDIKLDTNGSNPSMLYNLIDRGLVNYVAMDIKAPLEKYPEVIGRGVNLDDIARSMYQLIQGDVPFEFRSTVPYPLLSEEDLLSMARSMRGTKRYYLQQIVQQADLVGGDRAKHFDDTHDFFSHILPRLREILGDACEVAVRN